MKTLTQKDIFTSMFIAALLTIAKIRKQPKCPSVDEWMQKMQCIYICTYIYIYIVCVYIYIFIFLYIHTMEYYSAIKKSEILPFMTAWMGLEGIQLSEVSQREKDKYCMISFICGI